MMLALLLSLFVVSAAGARVSVANEGSGIIYTGRFSFATGGNWPVAGVRFGFMSENSTATVRVNYRDCTGNCAFYVDTVIDCSIVQKTLINSASREVSWDMTTVAGETYEVQFRKLTEASNGDAVGIMQVESVTVEGGVFVDVDKALKGKDSSSCIRQHKMLVIGDSITAAYGVEGADPCDFSASTENVDQSYASLVAAAVQADLHVVAWSGKGVVRNYGDANQMSATPMPDYYNRTIATTAVSSSTSDPNYWHPSSFPADIVLVMLGTNDYSTQPSPTDEQFTSGLVDLLSRIITDYPAAKGRIAAMCAPMAAGNQCANIEKATQQAGVHYVYISPSTLSGGYGCDGHPNTVTQQNMAAVVAPVVQSWLV